MKRLSLALCIVFVATIGLTGCEKKIETSFPTEKETQTSSLNNEAEKNVPAETIQSDNPQNATEPTTVKIEDIKNQEPEEEKKETVPYISKETVDANSSELANDEVNKKENQKPEEHNKYLGYWQLNNSDLIYNDVIKGFNPPLEIVSMNNNIFCGSLSFRMNDNYSMNPSFVIKIQEEIKNNKVNFEFEDKSFGSGHGVITLEDDTIEVGISLDKISEGAPFSIEGSKAYKKIPEENLIIITTPKDLFSYLRLNKKEMISKLGKDYEVITIDNGELESTGYYYHKYGLTFDFAEGEEYPASRIICNETVNINGAKAKMNFEQIQQNLGKGYIFEVNDERIPGKELKTYELFYKIYDTIIRFDSPCEDGDDSILTISYS